MSLVKITLCAKYVIISRADGLGDKMLSDTITMSATSKFEGLQNILVVHFDGHLITPDGRPDGWMNG